MNKINPLYVLAFFAFMAILMIVKSTSIQENIIEVAQKNALLESDGKYVSGLKSKWKDSKKSKKRVERVLFHSAFKDNIVSKNLTRGIYKIHLENLSVRTLDSFVNKMLGESVEIRSLQIDRMSDKNASLVMECVI